VHFLRIFRSKQREFLRFRCRIVAFQLINRALLTEAFPFVCVVFVLLEEFLEKRQSTLEGRSSRHANQFHLAFIRCARPLFLTGFFAICKSASSPDSRPSETDCSLCVAGSRVV
jgi:hypothetical protein